MPAMHLRQPGFTCTTFPKNKERIQEFKQTRNSRLINQIKLEKVCFQHNMAYRDFKDLPGITASDKLLCYKSFNIAKNPK